MSGRLDPDPDAISAIRDVLERVGYDAAQQALRHDYHSSPFPHFEDLSGKLTGLEPGLGLALRLLALGQSVPVEEAERLLGRAFAEAGLITGLLEVDEQAHFHSAGYSLVSLLGQHFAVSRNPYYPTFDATNADVYAGPDSYSLVHEIQRCASMLPVAGTALELCAGSGIAGQRATLLRPGLRWTAVDLSSDAVNAANFNASLNACADRYAAIHSDLYSAVRDQTFDLVIANPPFIPVPASASFPVYGSGGEDGLSVLGPLLRDLPAHLNPGGYGLIYAEGVGAGDRLLVEAHFDDLLASGRDVRLAIVSVAPIENALYTLGVMLSHQRPSRLPEIVNWRNLFQRLGCDHYAKFFVEVQPGNGTFTKRTITTRIAPVTPADTAHDMDGVTT